MPAELERLRGEMERQCGGRTRELQLAQWTGVASSNADELVLGAADEARAALFWIRLHGVMCEVRRNLEHDKATCEECGEAVPPSLRIALQVIASMSARFSADELVYIQARRDLECHPIQDAYHIQLNKDGSLRGNVTIRAVAEERTVEEVDAIIRDVERAANFSRVAVARRFARLVQEELSVAYFALADYYRYRVPRR